MTCCETASTENCTAVNCNDSEDEDPEMNFYRNAELFIGGTNPFEPNPDNLEIKLGFVNSLTYNGDVGVVVQLSFKALKCNFKKMRVYSVRVPLTLHIKQPPNEV